jgi:hypothetical protein
MLKKLTINYKKNLHTAWQKNVYASRACAKKLPTHAEHTLRIFWRIFKNTKKTQRVKKFSKSFWRLANEIKCNHNHFKFLPQLEKKLFLAHTRCANNIFGKKPSKRPPKY